MKDALAPPTIDLDALGFDRGAGLLLERALAGLSPGSRLEVVSRDPALTVDLAPWCRSRGHRVEGGNVVVKGDAAAHRAIALMAATIPVGVAFLLGALSGVFPTQRRRFVGGGAACLAVAVAGAVLAALAF